MLQWKTANARQQIKLDTYPTQVDPNYLWLHHLLKKNKMMRVKNLNIEDQLIADAGLVIRRLYSFNRLFLCSFLFKQAERASRPSLIFKLWNQQAAHDFQRTAVLLSEHTDTLCESLESED